MLKHPESVKHSHFNENVYIFSYVKEKSKEILNFCNESTFNDRNNIDRVIEMVCVRNCIIETLSICDHDEENLQIGVLDVLDGISLKVTEGNDENLFNEKKFKSWYFTTVMLKNYVWRRSG